MPFDCLAPRPARRTLEGSVDLSLDPVACLAWRAGAGVCACCAEACPPGVLKVTGEGPRLNEPCLGCGRCAAGCPSGALACEAFSVAPVLRNSNAPLEVECMRVPSSELTANALRVPCVGGVRLSRALEWVQLAGERPLRIIDRGACGRCPAGGASHSAARIIERLDEVLDACAWPEEQRPSVEFRALPHAKLTVLTAPAAPLANSGRRGFLLCRTKARSAAPPAHPIQRRARLRMPVRLPERERVWKMAAALANQRGMPAPAMLLPRLVVSGGCRNHGVCASLCPTGALTRYADDWASGLRFDAHRCLACGACVASCPEHAVSLVAQANDQAVPAAPERLTAFASRACRRCLNAFSDIAEAELCPECRRAESLARNLFGTALANRKPSS